METIELNGTTYTKALALAREFRYTADYLGQLCRAGKVDAQLVGRSWFVNRDSLVAHKSGRYRSDTERPSYTNRSTASGPRNKASSSAAEPKHFHRKILWNPVRYVPDDGELIPQLRKPTGTVAKLDVDPAEATRLEARGEHRVTTLAPTPLPEVRLSGTLKVASLETYFNLGEETAPAPVAVPERSSGAVTPRAASPRPLAPAPAGERVRHLDVVVASGRQKKPKKQPSEQAPVSQVDTRSTARSRVSFEQRLRARDAAGTPKLSPQAAAAAPVGALYYIHLAVILSAAIVALLWSLDARVGSGDLAGQSGFAFNFTHLADLLASLPF